MVTLYADENVRGAIIRGLRARGVDVLTVQEDGQGGAPDTQVLTRSTELGRVLYTEDDDLLKIAAEMQASGERFSGVLFGRQKRLAVGTAVENLELTAKAGNAADFVDAVLFLPL